jgi:hypothetical protein
MAIHRCHAKALTGLLLSDPAQFVLSPEPRNAAKNALQRFLDNTLLLYKIPHQIQIPSGRGGNNNACCAATASRRNVQVACMRATCLLSGGIDIQNVR